LRHKRLNWERTRGRPLVTRRNLHLPKFLSKESRLKVLSSRLTYVKLLHEWLNASILILCLSFLWISWVFGIFLETAWRMMNTRQATYHSYIFLDFLKGNRLAALSRPSGDASCQPIFLVLDKQPGGDEYPPSDTSQFNSILVIKGFWANSNWEKRFY